jgi:vancomycin resistance protein VanJ
MNGVAEVIRHEQPDILLLQELKPEKAQILTKALVNLYPEAELHFAYEENWFQAVISRFPLTSMEKIHNRGRAQKVLIETSKGPITVFNIHPPRGRWLRRHKQLSALLTEDIITADGPVILGGNFNTNDQSQSYRFISKYLHNSHWEAGWGFGFTYPSSSFRLRGKIPVPPLVRIDHIFYNDHSYVKNAGTLTESGGSDHLPGVAELFLNS